MRPDGFNDVLLMANRSTETILLNQSVKVIHKAIRRISAPHRTVSAVGFRPLCNSNSKNTSRPW